MLKRFRPVWMQCVPGQLIIQLTDRCNAKCPQCGMRVENNYPRKKLSLPVVKEILDRAAKNGIKIVSFTGGEPLIYLDELIQLINYAYAQGITYIRTGTNGFIFQQPEQPGYLKRIERLADKLAQTPLRNFWVSIDSLDPTTHEKIRGLPGVMAGIKKGLPIFHERGLYPAANLGINRSLGGSLTESLNPSLFKHQEEYLKIFQATYTQALRHYLDFVREMGFTMVGICYPMGLNNETGAEAESQVYQAGTSATMVNFNRQESHRLFLALLDVVPDYRRHIRIFTPLTALHALSRQYGETDYRPYPCLGGERYFFIDAQTGHTFPCGYRQEDDFGDFTQEKWKQGAQNKQCVKCDWECFRDPSELSGPILDVATRPIRFLKHLVTDRQFFKYWWRDMNYFRQQKFFDARLPMQS